MHPLLRAAIAPLCWFPLAACSFHANATNWNGRVGADGEPIFVKTTTNVGLKLLIIVPLLGNTTMDQMLDETSEEIAEEGGDYLRVIQTSTENYWYGFPPFTWILTPVITDVAIEYRPSKEAVEAARKKNEEFETRSQQRFQNEDRGHVIPAERRPRS